MEKTNNFIKPLLSVHVRLEGVVGFLDVGYLGDHALDVLLREGRQLGAGQALRGVLLRRGLVEVERALAEERRRLQVRQLVLAGDAREPLVRRALRHRGELPHIVRVLHLAEDVVAKESIERMDSILNNLFGFGIFKGIEFSFFMIVSHILVTNSANLYIVFRFLRTVTFAKFRGRNPYELA